MHLFVAYYRVSTERQGASGLGLDAQRAAVAAYVASAGTLIAEYEEVESGRRADRPQLAAALAACRAKRATLLVAKLDRLARNARFLLSIYEGSGDAGVAFCDLPQLPPGPMGKFFLTLMAAVAELEAGMISQRTKAALAAAKARGTKLGAPVRTSMRDGIAARGRASQSAAAEAYAVETMHFVHEARAAGARSLGAIAAALTARGVRTPRGGETWVPEQVRQLVARATT